MSMVEVVGEFDDRWLGRRPGIRYKTKIDWIRGEMMLLQYKIGDKRESQRYHVGNDREY
jgi:hypothetical protein